MTNDYISRADALAVVRHNRNPVDGIKNLPGVFGWISVEDRLPEDWVSVLGYMTDAGEFPSIRECYTVDGKFWFPALHEFHPVSHWMPLLLEPPKEENNA